MTLWLAMAIGTLTVIVLGQLFGRRRGKDVAIDWRWPKSKSAWRPHR